MSNTIDKIAIVRDKLIVPSHVRDKVLLPSVRLCDVIAQQIPLPETIANKVLWLSSDYGVFKDTAGTQQATAENDPVARWNDRFLLGNDFSNATDAQRPKLKLNVKNSLPTILSDGVDDRLTKAITQAQPLTVYAVLSVLAFVFPGRLYDSSSTGHQFRASTSSFGVYAGQGPINAPGSSWSIVCAVINGGSSSIQRNSGSPVSGNMGTTGLSGTMSLFSTSSGGAATSLHLGELIVYAAAHDSSLRSKLMQYLNTKWAVY